MTIDISKTSRPLNFGALIPAGTVAPMQVRIKPGNYGDGGLLTLADTGKGRSAYLHLEFVVTAGPHKDRKIWRRSTVEGDNHAAAAEITRDFLGSLARSAYNFAEKDQGAEVDAKLKSFDLHSLDGLRVIGKIGVERGKLDEAGERWPDKNTVVAGVTKDMKEWAQWGPVAQDPNDSIAGVMASPSTAAPIDPPPWADGQ
jgi:hypothetical protein